MSQPAVDVAPAKGVYIGAPKCFALEEALRTVSAAFGVRCCYLVGSCLSRQDWRDVDVRLLLEDERFISEFPGVNTTHHAHWEHDPRWLLLVVAISEWLSRVTGLPVDFQIQPMSFANARHDKPRSAMGFTFSKAQDV